MGIHIPGSVALLLNPNSHDLVLMGRLSQVADALARLPSPVITPSPEYGWRAGLQRDLYYFVTDHLGSTVALMNSSGNLDSDERYMPLGEDRDATGISRTD